MQDEYKCTRCSFASKTRQGIAQHIYSKHRKMGRPKKKIAKVHKKKRKITQRERNKILLMQAII
jgi:uncharacterized C2H2 Zn-finger protein